MPKINAFREWLLDQPAADACGAATGLASAPLPY
jgi:hypothetical protein